MTFIKPPIYFLTVDGHGEYAMRHPDGRRCLCLFTSEQVVKEFCQRREDPDCAQLTPCALSTSDEVLDFLLALRSHTDLVVFDPLIDGELYPICIDKFVGDQLSEK